jgi:putative ABC transport system permease protein
VSMIIFVGLFMGVAATGVVNTLLMSVFERTREFGVLRALGFRPASLMVLVVVESLWIGALGVLGGGIVGGLGDLWVVTQGIDLSVNGEGMRGANVQFDPILYGRVTWQTIVYPVVGVLVFSVLAAIWPAWRVGRLQPIDAIRDL